MFEKKIINIFGARRNGSCKQYLKNRTETISYDKAQNKKVKYGNTTLTFTKDELPKNELLD